MILGKGLFRVFFNKLNAADLILNSILTFCISVFFFYVFFPNTGYTDLKDFFVGDSIYANYNKYFDVLFVFLYTFTFFCTAYIYKKIKEIIFNDKTRYSKAWLKTAYTIQFLLLLSYLFLYPTDGNSYPLLTILIIAFMGFGAWDIRKKQDLSKADNKIHISFFAVTGFVLLCFCRIYCHQPFIIDTHHDAEHLSVYFMHTNYGMQYYKDIMLVHGYRDIAESILGSCFFGVESLYNYLLGKTLYYNILIIAFSALSLWVFKKNPAGLILPLAILYKNDDLTVLFGIYVLVFLVMLKDKIFKNNSLFLSLFIIFAFLFTQYWTTMGILWTIAVLPVSVYVFIQTLKQKEYKKLLIPLSVLAICTLINAKDIYYFFIQASFYTKGNLFGFGTIMQPLNPKNALIYYKLFPVLSVPALILLAGKEFFDMKNIKYFFTIIFALIFIVFSLNYTLGRIDSDEFTRLSIISANLIFIIIPYLVYKVNKDNLLVKYASLIMVFFLIATSVTKIWEIKNIKKIPSTQIIEQLEFSKYNLKTVDVQDSIIDITQFIKNNLKEDDVFLDLTNQGILYYLLDKKIPIPYTSYYNIVSQNQADYTLQLLKKNTPTVIYMDNIIAKIDNAYPSLRINPIYRYVFLENDYKLISDKNKNKALLVKQNSENQKEFTYEELRLLDKFFSADNLYFLPDSWGASLKKLPLQEISLGYILQKADLQDSVLINIHFDKPIKGSDIELIHINTPINTETNWVIQTDARTSLLFFKSKTGKMLIPFDNYPSWLLNKTITDITIKTNAKIDKPPIIKFYKRNN